MDSTITLAAILKMIDHSLLHPTMTDAQVREGCELAKKCGTATVCVKPYCIAVAKEILAGSDVKVCAVIGFPHGNSTTAIKIIEAEEATLAGAPEIDMVVNVGKVLSGDWTYVEREIRLINQIVMAAGGILKVIFENDFLKDEHIIRLCQICTAANVAFVKTSTGYGYVKVASGDYNYKGATEAHLRLMRANCPESVQIKAAGGIRTLDELLKARAIGVSRIGASATEAIMKEAIARGYGPVPEHLRGIGASAKAAAGY